MDAPWGVCAAERKYRERQASLARPFDSADGRCDVQLTWFAGVDWGWVWGGVGMLLSVPLTMVVKILMQNSDELRWLAILLDKSPDEPTAPAPSE